MGSLEINQTLSGPASVYNDINTADAQLLTSNRIRSMDVNERIIQPATVQAHVEDIYTPGDRSSGQRNRKAVSKRQAPRENGYPCDKDGCGKTFDRQCDLK
jgi:hypothetical protein